jgi:uncharacterized protein YdhG (YjbR/CyaY superfamily)
MKTSNLKYRNIDEYHASFPGDIQKILEQLRQTIKLAAPKAIEIISYGMPAFRQNKVLVYYAVYREHIGFYPTPQPIVHFKQELKKYYTSKGAIQLPINKPLPLALIKKIVKFRLAEDLDKTKSNIKLKPKMSGINKDIISYHKKQTAADKGICDLLLQEINKGLPDAEKKVWHGHPVWFLDGNPIVGYSKEKRGIRLMFWSGTSFDEAGLEVLGTKFKDASVFFNTISDINAKQLKRWLKKSKQIQWDYKNIVKRKGQLERLK